MSTTTCRHEEGIKAAHESCIDASVRSPLLLLFGNALHWLVVAAFLAFLASVKLAFPGFLGGVAFLGYGRLETMSRDLFLYGWASQAAIAAGIWLMARLSGRPLGGVILRTVINSAIVLWNLAVLLGTLAILAGYSTGVEWLEYPNWVSSMLLLSFLMIGIWVVCLFDRRANIGSGGRAETALWYIVAGFCCFPWVYGTANLLLTWKPVSGSAQGLVQGWFSGAFLLLWLLPLALASLYALLPRLSGQHPHRHNLSPLGFWLFLLLGGWAGLSRLIGGPIPAWMTSAGIVAGVLFLIPVLIAVINLAFLQRSGGHDGDGIAWQYLRSGLFLVLSSALLGAFVSLPDVSAFARFTGVTSARDVLWLLGAVSFTLLGVLHKATPALLAREVWCAGLSITQYWLAFAGVLLLAVLLFLEGLVVGLALLDPVVSFLNITSYAQPFHVLEAAAWGIFLASAVLAATNFTRALAAERLFPKN